MNGSRNRLESRPSTWGCTCHWDSIFALECVRQHCRAGDVVVLTPEYELLISDLQQGDAITINQLLAQWPEAVRYTDQQRDTSWKRFLDRDALWQTHEWVSRAYARITHRTKEGRIYERSSFNEYGDVVAHYDRPTPAAIDTSPLTKVDPKRLAAGDRNPQPILGGMHATRGVDVYLTFPPMPEEKYAASIDVIRQITQALETELEIPVLHPSDEFVFPLDELFRFELPPDARRPVSSAHEPSVKQFSDYKSRTCGSLPAAKL